MKKILFVVLTSIVLNLRGQEPLLIINNEKITSEEFLNMFHKNNYKEDYTQKDLEEYLELFINFRLKVAQAKDLKLDTTKAFRDELNGYRSQLASTYLTMPELIDKMATETHEKMLYDLRASHILVKVSKYASPKDTLAAYKKAMDIYNRLMKGESFEKLAVELSDDESAKGKTVNGKLVAGNKGDLGYFSALDLDYDFEKAAYKLKVGEISKPVRSEHGYHIIKLTEKRPALGKVQVAHILISVPNDATEEQKKELEQKANEIYNRIVNGEEFEALAKEFSDDKGSAMRGGVLPWFGPFRMVPDFITPLYDMNKGDVSKPVLTPYGYHIIKLIDRKPVGTIHDLKTELKFKVQRDKRNEEIREAFVAKLKKENGFSENLKNLDEFIKNVNDSILKNTWKASYVENLNKTLFTIGNKNYTQADFAKFLEKNQKMSEGDDKATFIKAMYNEFVKEMNIQYENENLENKYPKFASLMKEYRDGILLFTLTDEKVWSKAIKDTVGLEKFYNTINNDPRFLYPERVEAIIFTIKDKKTANKVYSEIEKAQKKGNFDPGKITANYAKKDVELVSYEQGIYIPMDHPFLGKFSKIGLHKPFEFQERYKIVVINRFVNPEPRPLKDVKGIITNEYQNYLEKTWIQELRNTYKWSVNEELFKNLLKK